MKKYQYQNLISFILIGILLLIFFWPAVIEDKTYSLDGVSYSDYLNFHYPNRDVYRKSLLSGKLPWWVSGIGNGYPLVADGQIGPFYPLNILFFRFLSTNQAINWLIFLHFWLAGIGMYLIMGLFTKHTFARLLTSITFILSGFMVSQLMVVNLNQTISLFPLLFWIYLKLIQKFKAYLFVVLIVLISLQILAGYMPFVYYEALILGLVVLVIEWNNLKKQILLLILLFFGFLISFGISAIQILPSLELMNHSLRGTGVNLNEATTYLYPKEGFLSFLGLPLKRTTEPVFYDGPNAKIRYKSPFLYNSYLGLLPLILIIPGIFQVISKKKYFLIVGSIWTFFMTLGIYTPVFGWFFELVPGMKFFRFSIHFLAFLEFFLSIIAGLGLGLIYDWFIGRLKSKKKSYQKFILYLVWIIVLVTFFDLFFHHRDFQPLLPKSFWLEKPEVVNKLMTNLGTQRINSFYLKTDLNFYDNWPIQREFRNFLPANFNLLFDISSNQTNQDRQQLDKQAYLLTQADFSRFLLPRETMMQFLNPGKINLPAHLPEKFLKLQSILAVKYLITPIPLNNENLKLFWSFSFPFTITRQVILLDPTSQSRDFYPLKLNTGYVYELNDSLPRVYLVSQAKKIDSAKNSIEQLLADDFNPKNQVLIEGITQTQGFSGQGGEAKIIKDSGDSLLINTSALNNRFLVLSDTYYPGWKAYVDGKESEIYQANYAYRAIYLDKGSHQVEFRYESNSFKYGLIISAASGTFLLLLLIIFYSIDSKTLLRPILQLVRNIKL
ncbi:YfhO family protein [Candidatus Daviesbacteria bacterium]|nr:YfhO family protein [Candidatus Daviesbacteria bacterium]